ncbi:cysteine hydrolase family protein [Rhodovibrionaceae bacterium A322]
MSAPKTLLEMAGAPNRPHALADSAVVMIDAQNEYVSGKLVLPGVEAALDEGACLLELARQAGRPVIHVQHKGKAGGAFDPQTTAFCLADKVAAKSGETVVTKTLPNAFAGTGLCETLKQMGVRSIIVAGFMTHMCVSSTVRAALDKGFGCTVVAGACTTRDLPDGKGGVVTAAEINRVELAALADRFAIVVPSSQDLSD